MMALQQPMARDLRELLALYHASAELERMGDYAVNIAKLAQQMSDEPEEPLLPQIPRWRPSAASSSTTRCARWWTSTRRRRAPSALATTRSTALLQVYEAT